MKGSIARIALTGLFTMLAAGTALAQMYPGEDVIVNPAAIPQPQGVQPLPPVHLHPPRPHRHHEAAAPKAASATVAPETQAYVPPSVMAPAPPSARKRAAQVAAKPPASPAKPAAIPFSFGGEGAAAPSAASTTASAPAPAQKLAKAAPLPKVTPEAGLSKQASVLFDNGSPGLSDNASATLKDISFSLKNALANGGDRIEVIGYGGDPGDTSSNARRLSLERALAVRQTLITYGIPPERIDVRALGGVTDNGATDRVDVFVKS